MPSRAIHHSLQPLVAALALAGSTIACASDAIDEVVVWGSARAAQQHSGPVSTLTRDDFKAINVATTEDLVKYEPSLVIRRRFIGDANGTLGLRGSNMFQTSRSMVFADGVPLHYLLQSRWNGAPRWTLVSASEIAQVDIIYGPFSAEYSGNAMGGVVVIESAIPQQREFHFDSTWFSQSFDAYGYSGNSDGYKSFVSWADRLGDVGVYASYNRLQSESQPQSFFFGGNAAPTGARPVTGAIRAPDDRGASQLWFGDTGVEDTVTDNYKVKLSWDLGKWQSLLNVAYEDRSNVSNQRNSYLRDASGNTVWSGNLVQDGRAFSVPANRLGVSEMERDSLNLGLRVKGELGTRSAVEFNVSRFDVLRDTLRSSARNPADPAYTPAGEITDFGATGWETADAKITIADFLLPGLALSSGARYEQYELNLDVYRSNDWRAGEKSAYTSRSGGRTAIAALFVQGAWQMNERWDSSLGLRAERWHSDTGYYSADNPATAAFDLVYAPGQDRSELSPKFSLGFAPDADWSLRYLLARAWRFPIVEELFSQYQAYNAINQANPGLMPERGLHHNLSVQRVLGAGSVQMNLYSETINDAIESQATLLPGGASLRTFLPMDEVQTDGVEFIINQDDLLAGRLDLRFNVAWTDSRIKQNRADPALEGKRSMRMPEWRGNLLATWQVTPDWDLSANLQYASDSFGRADNSDTANGVFGGQDGYTRLGLKTDYRLQGGLRLGMGVDNASDEVSYVAHPWPGRTWYLNLAYSL